MSLATPDRLEQFLQSRPSQGLHAQNAIDRFQRNRERLRYDPKAVAEAVAWMEVLKHTKGRQFARKPFILEPWQVFVVANLYGFRSEDGVRHYRSGYIEVARKNGKTTFAAALGLYELCAESGDAQEVFTAATKRDQAKIAFRAMWTMMSHCEDYISDYDIRLYGSVAQPTSIVTWHRQQAGCGESGMAEALSSEASGGELDGLNPSFALVDEVHAHPDASIIEALASGTAARDNALLLMITTAGRSMDAAGYVERRRAEDPPDRHFSLIFALDEGDDWEDWTLWHKPNPNIGTNPTIEALEQLKATTSEDNFKTKHLNMWLDKSLEEAPVVFAADKSNFMASPVCCGVSLSENRREACVAEMDDDWTIRLRTLRSDTIIDYDELRGLLTGDVAYTNCGDGLDIDGLRVSRRKLFDVQNEFLAHASAGKVRFDAPVELTDRSPQATAAMLAFRMGRDTLKRGVGVWL